MLVRSSLAFLLILFAGSAWSKEPVKAPQIKAEQQTNGAAKSEQKTQGEIAGAGNSFSCPQPIACNPAKPKSEANGEHAGEDGTEFWPPLSGYRLKITDTLLVAFTFLLFIATVALYCATRGLVKGADDTAKMQLRAYVVFVRIHSRRLFFDQESKKTAAFEFHAVWKNAGVTPALNNEAWADHRIIGAQDDVMSISFAPKGHQPGSGALGPSIEFGGGVVSLPIDTLISVWQKKRRLFLGAYVTYDSFVGGPWQPATEVCMELLIENDPSIYSDVPPFKFMVTHQKHNNMR